MQQRERVLIARRKDLQAVEGTKPYPRPDGCAKLPFHVCIPFLWNIVGNFCELAYS